METKSNDYSQVRRAKIGFGEIPPWRHVAVKVEQLTALAEIPVALEHPVVRVGAGRLRVCGDIRSGQFLQYAGGEKAIVYDENWHRLGELPLETTNVTMPTGQVGVAVSTEQAGLWPWLDVQFLTSGPPVPIDVSRPTAGTER